MTSNSVNISFTAPQLLTELLLWADMQEIGVSLTISWTLKKKVPGLEKSFPLTKYMYHVLELLFVFSIGFFILLICNYVMHNAHENKKLYMYLS